MNTDHRTRARQTIIEIAQRHQHVGTGSATAFLVQRTVEMVWIDFTSILAPIRWAVVGAAATRLYMPERFTRDLAIAVRFEDAQPARIKLTDANFIYEGELSIGGSTWRAPDGQLIDVIEGRETWWSNALNEAQWNRDAQGLPILPLRYLVLMKFQSGRVQDIADVTRMLGQADDKSLDAIRAIFKQYVRNDLSDLESLIILGKLEK